MKLDTQTRWGDAERKGRGRTDSLVKRSRQESVEKKGFRLGKK